MFALHLHQKGPTGCKQAIVKFESKEAMKNFLDTILMFADVDFYVFHIVDGNMLHITDEFKPRRV